MKTWTSCADCRQILEVADGENVHNYCTPPLPTLLDIKVRNFVKAAMEENDDLAAQLEAEINTETAAHPRLAEAALWYVKVLRWPVFPLRPGTKVPATPNGFKDATLDVDRVTAYWKANPQANIGLPTGIAFDVIDIDVPDGISSYQQILDNPRTPDIHGRVTTSSGGIHLFIKPTGNRNAARAQAGVDYRGIGGYVVAAPSWLGRPGTAWSWTVMPSPEIYGTENQ